MRMLTKIHMDKSSNSKQSKGYLYTFKIGEHELKIINSLLEEAYARTPTRVLELMPFRHMVNSMKIDINKALRSTTEGDV